jgi:hypothetical protein
MKFPALILFLLTVSSNLVAQKMRVSIMGNSRMETYSSRKGGDSIQFTIYGKDDTLLTTNFYRNGKPRLKSWKQDSIYEFDILGKLREKHFGWNKDEPQYWEKTKMWDSTVVFYVSGGVKELFSNRNNQRIEYSFDEEGKLNRKHQIWHLSSRELRKTWYGKNVLSQSSRTDTLEIKPALVLREYDTTFYQNGNVFSTKIESRDHAIFEGKIYRPDGSLYQLTPADSLKLRKFKDNVDCYYGLENNRGDTIVKPKFDRIEVVNTDLWAAYLGNSITLFDRNGAPIKSFAKQLLSFQKLENVYSENMTVFSEEMTEAEAFEQYEKRQKTYFAFKDGNQYGVVDEKGTIVLPLQALEPTGRWVDGGRFIQCEDVKDSTVWVGYMDKKGKALFNNRFPSVFLTKDDDYFIVSNATVVTEARNIINGNYGYADVDVARFFNYKHSPRFGLGKAGDTVVLAPQFDKIVLLDNTPLFVTTIYREKIKQIKNNEGDFDSNEREESKRYNGIFDAHTRRWILDSTGYVIVNNFGSGKDYLFIKNVAKNKYGLMDKTGQYILPIAYDSIAFSRDYELFWLKKGKKLHIFTIKDGKATIQKQAYDFLAPIFGSGQDGFSVNIAYFLAKRNNKWGIVDDNEKIIMPFDYDYAALNANSIKDFVLVKNNQAESYGFESLPYQTLDFPHLENLGKDEKTALGRYELADDAKRLFFINDTGKVVIPPQYKVVNNKDLTDYVFVEDAKGNRKVIFTATGAVVDFPFSYDIQVAKPDCRVLLVKDTAEIGFGVVSTSGKLLAPCRNYGVAIGDLATGTYFVKRDTPNIAERWQEFSNGTAVYVNGDTLTEEDNNWLMFDGDGKRVSDKPFRFPIYFHQGIGIGVKDDLFNLYQLDGSILPPFYEKTAKKGVYTEGSPFSKNGGNFPQKGFKNIISDPNTGHYTFFYSQGMTTMMLVTDAYGKIIVENGRYTGMTKFYDKYAFVYADNKIGLIDSFGVERIAPQDLRSYGGHFIDSIEQFNRNDREKAEQNGAVAEEEEAEKSMYKLLGLYQSIAVFGIEKRISEFHQNAFWNLAFERYSNVNMSDNFNIVRGSLFADARFLVKTGKLYDNENPSPQKLTFSDSTIAFVMKKSDYSNRNDQFYNYYRQNGRWKDLKINDLLDIQGDNRWKMNDLITQKVKSLRDATIDCSNTSAFIAQVENQWMLTKDGVDFCFYSSDSYNKFEVISLNWAELKGFLKFKIY